MSVPNAVFIDTCVFEELAYNFDSEVLRAFLEVAKPRKVRLIVPDPTQREVWRHIKEKTDEVVKALEDARRKAPFLSKWKHWPTRGQIDRLRWQLQEIADKEWQSFLRQLKVEKLDYSDVENVRSHELV